MSALSSELAKLSIPLRIETVDSFAGSAISVVKFARKHKCSTVYLNREYEVNELRRDNAVAASL